EPSTGGVDVTSQEAIGETGSRRSGMGERDQGTLASGARPEAAKEEIAAAPSVGTYFGPAATDSITGASKYPAQAGKGVGVPGETNAQVAAEKVATRQPGQPPVPPKAKTAKPVLGIAFDGTLFKENPDGSIGAPIPERIASLKEELAAGKEVEIESKRAGHPGGIEAIHAALESVGLPRLPVTAKKTAAPTLIDNEGIKEPGVEVQKVPTDANTPLPGTPERLEVPQSKSERHNEALRQAREKLGLKPGQTPTDFPGLSKLMKTADEIERGMREKPAARGAEVKTEATPRRDVISTEKAGYAPKPQVKGLNGDDTKLLTTEGEHPAKYRVVEAVSLIPSHNAKTFARNPEYPTGVQERAYDTSKEAQSRVIQQAQKYDPNYTINTNPDAVNGPPVITPDGMVLGGNSRAMSTQRLYSAGDGNKYKGALLAQAGTFGLDKEAIRAMKQPVLVREVAAPKTLDEMRAIGTQLNKSMTGALGVSERAVSAGKAISRDSLNAIAGMIDSMGDNASLRDAMRERGKDIVSLMVKDGAITERERPQFIDTATGGLSEEGKTFVERALLGSVVDDPRLMDAAPKSVLNKLDSSLAALASLAPRTDAYNIMPLLREALREHAEIAQKGIPIEDHLAQSSLFAGERNPAVDAIVRTLAERPTLVKAKLRQFAQDANFDMPGQATLALGVQPSPS